MANRNHSSEYKTWRKNVYARDFKTCQMPGCGYCGDKLNAHHIKTWNEFPHLRFDVSNGITLCVSCHKKISKKEQEYEEMFTEIVRRKVPHNISIMFLKYGK